MTDQSLQEDLSRMYVISLSSPIRLFEYLYVYFVLLKGFILDEFSFHFTCGIYINVFVFAFRSSLFYLLLLNGYFAF